jgi:small nuclear ribonucleoprotein (snRNP)-like protein
MYMSSREGKKKLSLFLKMPRERVLSAAASQRLREKKLTLSAVLEALVGTHVTVELKNNIELRGTLQSIHKRSMDMVMVTVVQSRPATFGSKMVERHLELAHVVGRMVRYVHIPNEVSIDQMLRRQAEQQRVSTLRTSRQRIGSRPATAARAAPPPVVLHQ